MTKSAKKRLLFSPAVVVFLFAFLSGPTTTATGTDFIRGDANVDKTVDVSDAICVLAHLFTNSVCQSPSCMDALDVNNDESVDLSDSVSLLAFLFQGGSVPSTPGPVDCGADPTTENELLGCDSFTRCDPVPTDPCPLIRVSLTGKQRNSNVAVGANGNFFVVWEDDENENDLFEILGAGYNQDGTELIATFAVNPSSSGQQLDPNIARDGDGNLVVVWESDGDNDGLFQVNARGFNADGTERFAQFTVNSNSAGQQTDPDIAMDGNGNFVVVWEDDRDSDGLYQVKARGFNADSTERFAQFTVNVNSAGQQTDPRIAMEGSGKFVVVWEDDRDSNGLFQVHGRGFDADGVERIARFTVNSNSAGQQTEPDIAMDGSGNFFVVWDDDRDTNGLFQIHGRGFDADGIERIAQYTVNVNSAGQQFNATVAMNATGDYAVAWEDDRDDDGEFHVRMRGFDADGMENFPHTKVDCIEPAQHLDPVIGIDRAGRIVVFWDDTAALQVTQVLGRTFPEAKTVTE